MHQGDKGQNYKRHSNYEQTGLRAGKGTAEMLRLEYRRQIEDMKVAKG